MSGVRRQPLTGDSQSAQDVHPPEAPERLVQAERRQMPGSPWLLAASSIMLATSLILVIMHLASADAAIPLAGQALTFGAIGLSGGALWIWMYRRFQREIARERNFWRSREAELSKLADREDVTQLYNRRYFYSRLDEELKLAAYRKRALSILMLDVDDLKGINDEFGHQVGDTVLRNFADVLIGQTGQKGLAARLGGDEFAVILPGADRRAADSFAWRLWDQLAARPVYETDYASIFLGVSIGVSGFPWGGTNVEELIHWADVKLYANKLARKGLNHTDDQRSSPRLSSAVVEVLSTALEVRDKMTHRHARHVARLSATVAREMHLSEQEVLTIEYAAALHDIGKIGVPDEILRKPAALDGAEWESMRSHPKLGYQILKGVDFLRDAAEIVYAHHERFDGGGYPRGLRGDEIPLGARVFAVVDAYDAMTSRRVYRDGMSRRLALLEVIRNAGTQFDPRVVEAFLAVVRRTPDGVHESDSQLEPALRLRRGIVGTAAIVGRANADL